MCGVFPRTRLIPLGALLPCALMLLAACGEPPRPPLKSPPLASPSAAPLSLSPSLPVGTAQPAPTLTATPAYPTNPTYPANPAYPGNPAYPTYVPPTYGSTPNPAGTVSPTPTPSHAPRCSGSPTRTQILTLIKGRPGIPKKTLKVNDGPYCAGGWSFSTVEVSGETEDDLEPLMVLTTGADATLAVFSAGSDVCTDRVQTDAPAGIRVLACGF
jgi:hypothetical protein